MLRWWKVVSFRTDVGPNHFNTIAKAEKNGSCWHSVMKRGVKPGHWRLTAVKLYPLAWRVHKSWLVQRNQRSMLPLCLINTWALICFTSSHRYFLSRRGPHDHYMSSSSQQQVLYALSMSCPHPLALVTVHLLTFRHCLWFLLML